MTLAAFDVAIVGGGASGTLLAVQLLRRAGGRLVVIDRAGDFARGIAFRTADPAHVLNVPAGRMSAFPDDDGHFLAWLRARVPSAGPETYAWRLHYGDYLSELLGREERAASPGTPLERRQAEVRHATLTREGVRLRLDPGPEVVARRVVLALGNFPPAPLPVSPAATPRVWGSPWPRDAAWPASDDAVLLVGAGLSAVDLVLSLAGRDHRGPVHVLSRHGLLPSEHRTPTTPALELAGLPSGRIRPLMRALRRSAEGARDWRAAVDGVRPHTATLWRELSDAERRRFARHVRTYWEVHRHRLAPEVAAEMQRRVQSGQLQLHAGRLLGLDVAGGRLEARLRPRGTGREERLALDLAVNCTGPAGHAAHADALVGALLRSGLARPGSLGLGLATDAGGAVLDARGQTSGRLWALGPVRRGDLWESVAIPDIRAQAMLLAERLTSNSAEVPSPPV